RTAAAMPGSWGSRDRPFEPRRPNPPGRTVAPEGLRRSGTSLLFRSAGPRGSAAKSRTLTFSILTSDAARYGGSASEQECNNSTRNGDSDPWARGVGVVIVRPQVEHFQTHARERSAATCRSLRSLVTGS